MYHIPAEVYNYLTQYPDAKGADVHRALGVPGRSARRYAEMFKKGEAWSNLDAQREYREPVPVHCRTAVFDIETTAFNATGLAGQLVCCSIFPLDAEKPYTIARRFEDKSDERVLAETLQELSTYDTLIGHYVGDGGPRGFDLKWLETRRRVYNMSGLRTWMMYDTYYEAKRQGIACRKKLSFLVDHFRLKQQKTSIYPAAWNDIREQHDRNVYDAALADIVEHCEYDVDMNRQVFYCLWPVSLSLIGFPHLITRWRREPDYAQL